MPVRFLILLSKEFSVRILLVSLWLMVPLPVIAYHLGPGQSHDRLESVDQLMDQADDFVSAEDWSSAIGCYDEALELLPEDAVADARRVRLEKSKAQMLNSQLPEAHAELSELAAEVNDDASCSAELRKETLATYANSQFYITWLMRLEGMTRDEWEPEIESSRQILTSLAEEAVACGDDETATRHREDLEASIKLARMDLSELEGEKIPKQCSGCCSCQCQSKKPSQKKGKKSKDSRGASSGPPADGAGS